MKRIFAWILAMTFIFMAAGCAKAEVSQVEEKPEYPTKQITMVIPWAAGGGTDITGRVFAAALERQLGQKVIVVNKPGASGATGTEYVASQAADGYTLLFSADTIATLQCMGVSTLSVDDFMPLMMVSDDPKILTVAGNSKYETMSDLVEDAKARPGKLNMAYSAPGASGHIQGLLMKKAGLVFNMTPLGGGTAQMLSVISGQSDVTNPSGSTVTDYLKTGELRNLAVFSDSEIKGYEGVEPITATVPELKDYMPITFPVSIHVKAGTDTQVYDALLKACQEAAKDQEWKKFVEDGKLNDLTDIQGQDAAAYIKRLTSISSWLLYDEGVATKNPADFNIPRQ